jgi:hypothetical protein
MFAFFQKKIMIDVGVFEILFDFITILTLRLHFRYIPNKIYVILRIIV